MIALAILMSVVAMFWLGRAIGRAEAAAAIFKQFSELYAGLSLEEKLQFDKWVKDFAERSKQ
jgi:DNA-binding SARP family transcriptional activator